MFYQAHQNPLGFAKLKKMIKVRTSPEEQEDKSVRRVKESYQNCNISDSNKENQFPLPRQNKRVSENSMYSDHKNDGLYRFHERQGVYIPRENQFVKKQISFNQKPKMVTDQNNPFHGSIVQQRQKIERLLLNNNISKYGAQLTEPCGNNYSLRYSRNITSRGPQINPYAHYSQFEHRVPIDRSSIIKNINFPLTRRKPQKIKTQYINKNNKTQRFSISITNPSPSPLPSSSSLKSSYIYNSYSIKGTKQHNQDTIKVSDHGVYIVCDGHGEHGHHVSSYVAHLLHDLYVQRVQRDGFSRKMLRDIFLEVQQNLQESGIQIQLSGSTCVMVVIVDGKGYCACLGDSVAITVHDQQKYQIISAEHKPSNQTQAQRIQFFGGVVKKTNGKEHLASSPLRLWGQGPDQWGPGLAISRSFGDKMAQKYGLIYQPQIKQFSLDKSLRFIVLGSDGLFDQIRPTQIANILSIQKTQQKQQGCKLLAQIAQSRWLGYSDDISAVVLHL